MEMNIKNELILIIRRYNLLISTSLSINEILDYLIDSELFLNINSDELFDILVKFLQKIGNKYGFTK